jgi:hypothetical protein
VDPIVQVFDNCDRGLPRSLPRAKPLYLSIAPSCPQRRRCCSQTLGIENKQHYTRHVTLREDAWRIRRSPGIFPGLRSFAYNILRFNPSDTIAQDRYASALGGLEALSDRNYYKER